MGFDPTWGMGKSSPHRASGVWPTHQTHKTHVSEDEKRIGSLLRTKDKIQLQEEVFARACLVSRMVLYRKERSLELFLDVAMWAMVMRCYLLTFELADRLLSAVQGLLVEILLLRLASPSLKKYSPVASTLHE